tara:strand:+ start:643 stop:1050 length:408 start_codon:yes stop_codon:yes gene_type:complete
MDKVDKRIVEILKEDAKQNFKSIGAQIHMTGQGVGNRIRRLEETGIIEKYTIKTNPDKEGLITAHITLFMKSNDHYRLKRFVSNRKEIKEAVRVSGEGCYFLRVEMESHDAINTLCDELLEFANYRVSIVTDRIK